MFLAHILLSAGMHLIIIRMVFLLFPTMGKFAPILMLAPVCICRSETFGFPVLTLVLFILIDMRLASEVLPVVSIDAEVSGMGCIAVGTPNCLKVKHVKVRIFLEFVQEIDGDFFFRMCEGTHVTIVTALHLVWVSLTELDLILLRVIKFFHSIM